MGWAKAEIQVFWVAITELDVGGVLNRGGVILNSWISAAFLEHMPLNRGVKVHWGDGGRERWGRAAETFCWSSGFCWLHAFLLPPPTRVLSLIFFLLGQLQKKKRKKKTWMKYKMCYFTGDIPKRVSADHNLDCRVQFSRFLLWHQRFDTPSGKYLSFKIFNHKRLRKILHMNKSKVVIMWINQ